MSAAAPPPPPLAPHPAGGAAARAVERLAEAAVSLLPVHEALAPPVRVAHPGWDGATRGAPPPPAGWVGGDELLRRAATRVGLPPVVVCPAAAAAELPLFQRAVSAHLAGPALGDPACAVPAASLAEADAVVRAACEEHRRRWPCAVVRSFDGTPLRAYTAGHRGRPVVVVAAVCGMPAALCGEWLRALGREYFVLTWETRGMFGAGAGEFDHAGWEVETQARDLFAVMDHFRVETAHLVGLCGGAALALAAAALRAPRVRSLSLWHGDYELGPATPRTPHQRNLKALMSMAAEGRGHAADVHRVLSRSRPPQVPPGVAHLVLYPYASAELLYRYCTLNGRIMNTDLSPWLPRVRGPALVVTSHDDDTSHPEASRRVAAAVPGATLRVLPRGHHLAAFEADAARVELAARFIAGEPP